MADDPVAAELAAIRERYCRRRFSSMDKDLYASAEDVAPLLAAVEAVLAQHQPGCIVVLGSLCKHHESCRHFSITSTEAAGVAVCADCTATVYTSCAGCGPQMPLDQCPARMAISRALLGEEGGEHV